MAKPDPRPDDAPTYDNLGPVAYIIPVPLIVLALCDPRQLMVWIALRWLAEVFPEAEREGGISYRTIAKLCKIDRRSLDTIFQHLLKHTLIYEIGSSPVWRARGEHSQYGIDDDHLEELTRSQFTAILARWQIPSNQLPHRVPKEQLTLFESMSGTSGITPSETSGTSGITPSETSGTSGITPSETSGTSGITDAEQRFTIVAKGNAPFRMILVPLVVFDRCEPSELATWMTHCWLFMVKAGRPGALSGTQVAEIGTIGRGKLSGYYGNLLTKRLIIHVGTSHEASDYLISHQRILMLNAEQAGRILAKWKVKDLPIRLHTHHTQMTLNNALSGTSGITPSGTSGTSGITEARKQPSLKRKELKGRDKDSTSHDSFETPDAEPVLDEHPLDVWRRVHPDAPAADIERLRRLATEHDAPHGAYPGGYGMYWLGRAVEAALTKSGRPLTLQYVRGMMRSWRERTTDDTSAYGWDAPNHRAPQRKSTPAATPASAPAEIAADLVELWQRVLDQFKRRLDRTTFETWLQDSVLLELDGTTAIVGVSHVFAQERVRQEYASEMAAALTVELQQPITVEVVIGGPHAA